MIHTIYNWPGEDFSYLRICKCASSTLVNHFHNNNHLSIVSAKPAGAIRFAAIRHPVRRIMSLYARSYRREGLKFFVRTLLPELMQTDHHAMPYAEIERLATHIRAVENMDTWWHGMYVLKPGIFGDYPRRRANQSNPDHLPQFSDRYELEREILRLYPEDLTLWMKTTQDPPLSAHGTPN